ncbi:MAG: OmpA family protein [Phormidesmis sp.]
MKQPGCLIVLSACLIITACDRNTNTTTAPPTSGSSQESPEPAVSDSLDQAESNQASSQNESLNPSAQDGSSQDESNQGKPSNLGSANSLQRDTGSALTASVSDLNGLVSDLGGQVTETEIVVDLPADVLFDFDKADIRQDAVPTLEKLARLIGTTHSQSVQINGHTDSKGSDDYNMELSQGRADSVGAWLIEKGGIEAGRLQTVGYGETKPVAKNELPSGADDPAGRAKNRRVEIIILK